jgi:predicted MPP superfamily phosphohydrolase
MRSQVRNIFLFFTGLILLIDGIVYGGLRNDFFLIRSHEAAILFWLIPMALIITLFLYSRRFLADNRPGFFAGFYKFSGIFLTFYIPKLFYVLSVLGEYLLKLLAYPVLIVFSVDKQFMPLIHEGPLDFISLISLPFSLLAFILLPWGMLFGRFNFKVKPVEITSGDLPENFDGFRLVHISDLHLGSLYGKQQKLRRAIEMINRESPDLIVFTGDLVNNLAEEAEGWTGLLSEMESREGKYSILGNHDYGEYYHWHDEAAREANMQQLYEVHRKAGFTVLLNRNEVISRGNQKIFIAGTENWGLPPFKQYGDLDRALKDLPEDSYTILLSHDPSHWDAEILAQSRAQLTLSGHTHGMQFGIRIGRFRWSPIKWKYPRWYGLYSQDERRLYVNPGLGYIGYAGRIGMPPEITVITLRRTT